MMTATTSGPFALAGGFGPFALAGGFTGAFAAWFRTGPEAERAIIC